MLVFWVTLVEFRRWRRKGRSSRGWACFGRFFSKVGCLERFFREEEGCGFWEERIVVGEK